MITHLTHPITRIEYHEKEAKTFKDGTIFIAHYLDDTKGWVKLINGGFYPF